MRTTVTLDSDTEVVIRRLMTERGLTFKQAVNEAIRHTTMIPSTPTPFETPTYSMGRSAVNLDKALALAGDIEDDELIRKMREGS